MAAPKEQGMTSREKTRCSRTLTRLLRHNPGGRLPLAPDGYVAVATLLADKDIVKLGSLSLDVLREIVRSCPKQRFALLDDPKRGGLLIRANQGHSAGGVETEALLEPISLADAVSYEFCVHGTDRKGWAFIRTQGLSKMGRQHVHFSSFDFGSKDMISGMRARSEVLIYLDLPAAIKGGLKFFISANKVILSEGDASGFISPKFFSKVMDARTREPLSFTQEDGPVHDFDCLAVLDFEATCDDGQKIDPQEIIEVPVVLLDIRGGRADPKAQTVEGKSKIQSSCVMDEFHTYIKPQRIPKLTPFCTNLTGITQAMVDAGVPFPDAMNSLTAFFNKHNCVPASAPRSSVSADDAKKPLRTVIVTCGDWDIRSCLKRQREILPVDRQAVHPVLKEWINIKRVFTKAFNMKQQVRGMVGMLEKLDMKLIGRHHSGIDDTRNIARIAQALIEKGVRFLSSDVKKLKQTPAERKILSEARKQEMLAMQAKTRAARNDRRAAAKAAKNAAGGAGASPAIAVAAAAASADLKQAEEKKSFSGTSFVALHVESSPSDPSRVGYVYAEHLVGPAFSGKKTFIERFVDVACAGSTGIAAVSLEQALCELEKFLATEGLTPATQNKSWKAVCVVEKGISLVKSAANALKLPLPCCFQTVSTLQEPAHKMIGKKAYGRSVHSPIELLAALHVKLPVNPNDTSLQVLAPPNISWPQARRQAVSVATCIRTLGVAKIPF